MHEMTMTTPASKKLIVLMYHINPELRWRRMFFHVQKSVLIFFNHIPQRTDCLSQGRVHDLLSCELGILQEVNGDQWDSGIKAMGCIMYLKKQVHYMKLFDQEVGLECASAAPTLMKGIKQIGTPKKAPEFSVKTLLCLPFLLLPRQSSQRSS
ncbi:hypothetical protein VNO77_44074 [Canavalia gladiata]|uniref:Uncharacterized protein n=1 Tax=Canavalia gladiata TaxID=3824 RepID=A0AAN9PQF1_CANGL